MNLFNFKSFAKNIVKISLIFTMFFYCFGYVNAALIPTITSTSVGGNWSTTSTWNEGRIPTVDDVVEINGTVSLIGNITVSGVLITGSGILKKTNVTDALYTLTVSGSLENNGIIGGDDYYKTRNVNIDVLGDVLNNGTINYLRTFSIHGNLQNNETINNIYTTYLKWLPIDGYSDYIMSITGETDTYITNDTKYLIPLSIIQNGTNLYWKVKGAGELSDSEYTEPKCINVPGCVSPITSTNETPSILGELTSTQLFIGLYNQYFFPLSVAGIKDLDEGQTLTLSYSVDGNNYTNLSGSLSTPLENTIHDFYLDLSNLEDGNVTIDVKVNDGVADSNVESLTLKKGILFGPNTLDKSTFIIKSKLNVAVEAFPILDSTTTGDPVNLHTGEFTYSNTLMQHQSVGMPFELKINYLNQTYYNGPLGNNFDFNYNQKLIADIDGNMYYHNGALGVFKFTKSGSLFEDNTTLKANLTENSGLYTLEINNRKTLTFNTDLRLETITDNFGNTLTLQYNELFQVTKIIDTNSREYLLSYYDHSRLKDVTDFNSNKIEFIYFGTGELDGSEYDLKTIKTISGTSEKEISFTYTKEATFEASHNILKLIDSENNIYVENIYDEFDRVSSQKYGDSTIYYSYTTDSNNKIIENSVTDREGVNTILTYNNLGNVTKKVVKKLSGDIEYNYEYTSNGYISKEIFPLGNGFTYSYDSNNNLIEKRQKSDLNNADNNSLDIVTSYEYDQIFNKITKITLPNGTVINFTLDINGNITQKETLNITDLDNQVQTITENYEYNSFGELIKIIDAKGNQTSFEYVNGNLVKSIKNSLAPLLQQIETNYSYDSKGNISTITDGEGNITNLSYDDFNLLNNLTTPEGIQTEYIYNNLNKKTNQKIILENNESVDSNFSYDILDNPTQITTDIDNTRTKTIVTQYDNNSRITEIQSGNSAKVQFIYDELGNITQKKILSTPNQITSYEYDNNNRLVKQINPNNSETNFEYDLFNKIIKQTLQTGTYTTLDYDKVGNVTETKTFDSANTLLQKQTNSFDGLSRKTKTSNSLLDTNTEITTKRYYDNVGNIIKIIDPKNNETNYNYDVFNRLETITDTLGNIITNTYNKNDKLTSRTIAGTTGNAITTSYIYDTDNRLTSETNNLNQTTFYTYNKLNQVISKTDKDNGVTLYSYDYTGNLVEETHGTKVISYEYDIEGNLTKLIDAKNNVTTYEYDSLNRLIKQTYPDLTFLTNEYDINNNLTQRTDPNGTVTTNNFDSLNRLTARTIATASGVLGVKSESYTYDELGRLISGSDNLNNDLSFDYDSLNRLISETNSNQTVNYVYDNNNNITSINNTNYSYDSANRLLEITSGTGLVANYNYSSLTQNSQTLGNGVTTNYSYDELLRLSSLLTTNNTQTIDNYNYSYNPNGNITSNGQETYSYDNLDQITQAEYTTKHIKKIKENFTYDLMGNREFEILTKLTNSGIEKQKQFQYTTNILNQYTDKEIYIDNTPEEIIEEETNTGTTQTITSSGTIEIISTEILTEEEIIEEETGTGEILEEEQEIELDGNLIYDKNGNLIGNKLNNKRQYIYSYDYKNRLVKIQKNKYKKVNGSETNEVEEIIKIVEIKYDILGRRIEKKFNNGSYRKYYYTNNNIILEENYTKKDKLKNQKEFIYSNRIDDILSVKNTEYKTRKIQEEYINNKGKTKTRTIKESYTETNRYYYTKNHLNSVLAITDETGTIVEEYEYDVFGKPYTKKEDGTITRLKKSKIGNTRLYTGREYDRGLKLYYNRARYYSPKLGRFINRDPIDIADDVNLYAYVGNNGVMFVDLMGREKTLVIGFTGYTSIPVKGSILNKQFTGEVENWISVSGVSGIGDLIGKFEGKDNYETKLYYGDYIDSTGVELAYNYILKNIKEYNKIVIVGHSMGASNSVRLANLLYDDNIKVDLLVTVDNVSPNPYTRVTENVVNAVNFYQTDGKNGSSLGSAYIAGRTVQYINDTSNITNINYSQHNGRDINHTEIDNVLVDAIYGWIEHF